MHDEQAIDEVNASSPYEPPSQHSSAGTRSWSRISKRVGSSLACFTVAIVLFVVIKRYYPPSMPRSEWAIAFALILCRNAFIGAGIGVVFARFWVGLLIGAVLPPIIIVFLYGLPG